jgi:hypothetical protein
MKIRGIFVKNTNGIIEFENVIIQQNNYKTIATFLGEGFQIRANDIEADEIIAFPNSEIETNNDINFKKRLYIGIDGDGNFVDCGITIPILKNYFLIKYGKSKV